MADDRIRDVHARAAILAEALPYIREFSGRTVVIKYGGHAMEDPALADLFAQDVVLMHLVGIKPVVTDAETVDIVRMALVGKVNREVVSALNRHGSYAVGLSGEDANLLLVRTRDPRLGFVGDVEAVDPAIVERLQREDLIPVIATVGVDEAGQVHNVNADAVAAAIAVALQAEKLVYLTDVLGVYESYPDEASLISQIDVAGMERLLAEGKVGEGMIPKLRSCIEAIESGVGRAHILDGRVPHALLLEFFTREGIGTMITHHSTTGDGRGTP